MKRIFLIISLLFISSISQINAAVDIGATYQSPYNNVTEIGRLVSSVLSNVYLLSGVVFLFLVALGGLKMIQNAGAGDQRKTAQAKEAVTYALFGFLLIFASYWIIRIIEMLTGLTIAG